MNNNLKQQVSEFLDDEMDSPAALRLLTAALEDSQIAMTLNRYATIRQAIKNDGLIFDDGSFLTKVSAQIQREPAYLLPRRKPPALKETLNKLIPFRVRQAHHERNQLLAVRPEPVEGLNQSFLNDRRYPLLALAASIAIVAVLGTQSPDKPATDLSNTGLAVAELASDRTKTGLETTKPELAPLNERINDYLQAHNNGVYTSGGPNLQPSVKVTAYSNNR